MKKIFKTLIALCLCVFMTCAFAACGNDSGKKPNTGTNDGKVTLNFANETLAMTTGAEVNLTVSVTGNTDESVKFSSSAASVARIKSGKTTVAVNADGEATTIVEARKEGRATITAAIGDEEAIISVTVKDRGIFITETEMSAAPGESHEFEAVVKDLTGDVKVESSNEEALTATAEKTSSGATITFTAVDPNAATAAEGDAEAPAKSYLGETVTLTVSVDGTDYSESVEIDICSKGIIYGDTYSDGLLVEANEYRTAALGVGEDFVSGALAIPRNAYTTYKKDGEDVAAWVRVTNLGCGYTGDKVPHPFEIPEGKTVTSVNTGDAVTTIQHEAFKHVLTIESVHIGENVVGIGDSAFEGDWHWDWEGLVTDSTYDSKLSKVTFSLDCKIGTIGSNAFAYNPIKTLILPDSISTIAGGAFQFCAIETLKLPANWKQADYKDDKNTARQYNRQFNGLNQLKNLYMPWQNFFAVSDSVSGMRQDAGGQPKAGANAAEIALIKELGVDTNFGAFNTVFVSPVLNIGYGDKNWWQQGQITVYYMGDKALADNMLDCIWRGETIASLGAYVPAISSESAGYSAPSIFETFMSISKAPEDTKDFLEQKYENGEPVFDENGDPVMVPVSKTRWAYGNEHTKWTFGATCPYNVDGTVKA